MPITILTEYTAPSTGIKESASVRIDVVKIRADKLPDGADNADLGESVFLEVTGPTGTTPYRRLLDGHILDGMLGIIDGSTVVVGDPNPNGGTPGDALGLGGVCGIISQLERPAIPTNVQATYTPTVVAGSVIAPDPGNTGDDSASVGGTFGGTADIVWTAEVTTGGAADGIVAEVTVYEKATPTNILATFNPLSGSSDPIADGVTITFTEVGGALTLGDKWDITNTAAVAEGVLVTWTDSPDIVAKYYKVMSLIGPNYDTEVEVTETSGSMIAQGVGQVNVTSLNAAPDNYKFAVYATSAATAADAAGSYNQSLRSGLSNQVTIV